jgi:hypothetical protein
MTEGSWRYATISMPRQEERKYYFRGHAKGSEHCRAKELSINSSKVEFVLFINKNKAEGFTEPTLPNSATTTGLVKYLVGYPGC